MVVEVSWVCPPTGKCSQYCGNGIFDGIDSYIGQNESISVAPLEECDDGNKVDGDGCSKQCKKEKGFSCDLIFSFLLNEVPKYVSRCYESIAIPDFSNNAIFADLIPNTETVYYEHGEDQYQVSDDIFSASYQLDLYTVLVEVQLGYFSHIESNEDENLIGIVYSGYQHHKFQGGLYNAPIYFHYIETNQKVADGIYNKTVVYDSTYFMLQKKKHFGTFGKYIVTYNSYNYPSSLQFSALTSQGNSGGEITLQDFHITDSNEVSPNRFGGSQQIFYWPWAQSACSRLDNGYDWKCFALRNSTTFYTQEKRFKNTITIEGKLTMPPVFVQNYIFVYVLKYDFLRYSLPQQKSYLQIYKYFEAYDHLELMLSQSFVDISLQNSKDSKDSFCNRRLNSYVYFGKDFGVVFKQHASDDIYLINQNTMSVTQNAVKVDFKGFVMNSMQLQYLKMFQRSLDPDNSNEEDRDVYGIFTFSNAPNQDPYVYKLIGNSTSGNIEFVERIAVPSPYIQVFNGFFSVGKYHLAFYQNKDCDSQEGGEIKGGSLLYYTFSRKSWRCENLLVPTSRLQQSWKITHICGNSQIEQPEHCDDGNQVNGDGCSSTCKIESGYTCSNQTGQASTCTKKQSVNGKVDTANEVCDDGNNFSGIADLPFAKQRLNLTSLIETNGQSKCNACRCGDGTGQCDDGIEEDGCASDCIINLGYQCTVTEPDICTSLCVNKVFDRINENYMQCDYSTNCDSSACLLVNGEIPSQYATYKQLFAQTEPLYKLDAYKYSVVNDALINTFYLIEHPTNTSFFGILNQGQYRESTNRQKLRNLNQYQIYQISSENTLTLIENQTYLDEKSSIRGVFGKYMVETFYPDSAKQIKFYALRLNSNSKLEIFYATSGPWPYGGSHSIFYWPGLNSIMIKQTDNQTWSMYGFRTVDVSKISQIEFMGYKEFQIKGQISAGPVFIENLMVIYLNVDTTLSTVKYWQGQMKVYRYDQNSLQEIASDDQITEKYRNFTSDISQYRRLNSMVYFRLSNPPANYVVFKQVSDYGFKIYNLSIADSSTVRELEKSTYNISNTQQYPEAVDTSQLKLFQRRIDPDNNDEADRPVFGFFSNIYSGCKCMDFDKLYIDTPAIYRFELTNDLQGNLSLAIAEKIQIKYTYQGQDFSATHIQLTKGFYDIGKYRIVVYQIVQCGTIQGQNITSGSLLSYTFSTKKWTCYNINLKTSQILIAWLIKNYP